MGEYTRTEQIVSINGIKFICESKLEGDDLDYIKNSWKFNEKVIEHFLCDLHELGIYLYLLEEVEILKI